MRLLLDEMHSHVVAEQLRRTGIDAVAVTETAGLRNRGDHQILAWATEDDRAVVTENLGDFRNLDVWWAAEGRSHAGIVLTNPRRFPRKGASHPGRLINALRTFVADPPVSGRSWVWWLT